ncbi:hypothetical protein DYE50_07870 [Treponema ruminis]|uniref:DUF5723 domain-containing protein n=1 Tax=Treponema ruminis TaxID=744515 RepID=A0A7W8G8R2_9SPIR|nr:hypothetical protein [Treponema ruminis]MBB5225794.1 hypothetical protein [Treponema ruminis]QSI02483.1 hypothetical protein DYE50_07870 [Treponema ruminis]
MKKILRAIIFLLAPSLFAGTFFSGETGLASSFVNKKSFALDPALVFSGFLGGQLAISKSFSVQGEFSIQTGDLYENGVTKEADAIFRLNELSGTFTQSFMGATHTLTLFKGCNESIGSQKFIIRRLGVEKYSSLLTESYLGQNGLSAYEVFGTGGSYSLTLRNLPASFGLVVSKNYENEEKNDDDAAQLNADLRFAMAGKFLTIDMLAGLGAPLYTKNSSNEDVVLLIDTLYLHSGADILIGNKYSTSSLFLQFAFDYFPVRKSDNSRDFDLNETHFIFEPRFKFGDARLNISIYNIPSKKIASAESVGKSFLIEDTFGLDMQMYAETMYKKHRNYTAGLHCMVGFEGKHFKDFGDSDFMDKMNVKFCPFTEIEADGGKVNVLLTANMNKFADSKPGAFKLHIGYKKEF